MVSSVSLLYNFDFNLFIEDLAKYCNKYSVDFWSNNYKIQKSIIRYMLRDISRHFSCTCKDYKIVKSFSSIHLRKKNKV